MNIDATKIVRWSKGSSGLDGCLDPECACAVCGRPIGVPESDPRWLEHDSQFCPGCELCEDDVPITLWRGEAEEMEEARMHVACFRKILIRKVSPDE